MSIEQRSTLKALADLLGGEGYSEQCHNEIKRYYLHNQKRRMTLEAASRVEKVQRAFGKMAAAKLDEGDQLILGKFISLLCHANFDTGLRLGLMTLAADFTMREKE